MKFLIVGLGSIGKRHQENLKKLNHQVIPVHRDDNLEKKIKSNQPDAIFICNPTSMHLKTANVALEYNLPIFLEKPLSHNLNGVNTFIQEVEKKQIPVLVGYCLRWQKGLMKIKNQLCKLKSLNNLHADIFYQSFLPDWRPGRDYCQIYSSQKNLGGGVLLDLSHEIYYAIWFFGRPKTVKAKLGYSPELKIDVETKADLELTFINNIKSRIYLDMANKKIKRGLQIIGKKQFNWSYPGPENMYLDEIKHFINMLNHQEESKVKLSETKIVLETIEAAKKADKTGKIIKI